MSEPLIEIYRARNGAPIWQDSDRLHALVEFTQELEEQGLIALPERALDTLNARRHGASVEDRIQVEIQASEILVTVLRQLSAGRLEPRLEYTEDGYFDGEASAEELFTYAVGTGDPAAFARGIVYDNLVLTGLRDAYERYRKFDEGPAWPQVAGSDDELIRPGDSHPSVRLLRARLHREGFYPDYLLPIEPDVLDDATATALKAFQRTRRIAEDGVLGPNTVRLLNKTPQQLLHTIRLNQERARWLPADLGERYILVDIARYQAEFWEHGSIADTMAVIVGTRYNKTPVFADVMKYIVVNPYWNVPDSILTEEIAPKVVADPGYLESQNMETVRGWGSTEEAIEASLADWQAAAAGQADFRVRQKPGDINALGRVKLMFPNPYSIYLHDTPADALFDEDIRTFSHGCIRLARPHDAAKFALKYNTAFTPQDYDAQVASGERLQVQLEEEIPVYITYFTAYQHADGTVYFSDDVYQRDDDLAVAFGQQTAQQGAL